MIEELILNYDKIAILYLCFEKILKKMYKLGNQFVDFNERSLEQLRESVFIENKIFKLKEALKKYSAYYREFIALVKSK
jgi:ABC-type Fe3+-hydroxamate transport system substrate-binding protein